MRVPRTIQKVCKHATSLVNLCMVCKRLHKLPTLLVHNLPDPVLAAHELLKDDVEFSPWMTHLVSLLVVRPLLRVELCSERVQLLKAQAFLFVLVICSSGACSSA